MKNRINLKSSSKHNIKNNFNGIPKECKGPIKNNFTFLSSNNYEPEELWIETRYIIKKKWRKIIPAVKSKEKPRCMNKETLKYVKGSQESKMKGERVTILSEIFSNYHVDTKRSIIISSTKKCACAGVVPTAH